MLIILVIFTALAHAKILPSYAYTASIVMRGVVNIRTKVYVKKPPRQDVYRFFMQEKMPHGKQSTSLGSGIIIGKDGYVITNYHIIDNATKIEVLSPKSRWSSTASIIGVDHRTNLALLRLKRTKPVYALSLGNSSKIKVGDIVLAVGNPFGYSHIVTSGIISAKGQVVDTGPYAKHIQTDAAINPGNYGGPLVDLRGRVIGVNTLVNTTSSAFNFAIPSNLVRLVIADLKKYGKVIRPWLGIIAKNILSSEDIATTIHHGSINGIIVKNIVIDSPAHSAGLKIGDLIMAINDKKIFSTSDFEKTLLSLAATANARLKIFRRTKGTLTLLVKLKEQPQTKDLPLNYDIL